MKINENDKVVAFGIATHMVVAVMIRGAGAASIDARLSRRSKK